MPSKKNKDKEDKELNELDNDPRDGDKIFVKLDSRKDVIDFSTSIGLPTNRNLFFRQGLDEEMFGKDFYYLYCANEEGMVAFWLRNNVHTTQEYYFRGILSQKIEGRGILQLLQKVRGSIFDEYFNSQNTKCWKFWKTPNRHFKVKYKVMQRIQRHYSMPQHEFKTYNEFIYHFSKRMQLETQLANNGPLDACGKYFFCLFLVALVMMLLGCAALSLAYTTKIVVQLKQPSSNVTGVVIDNAEEMPGIIYKEINLRLLEIALIVIIPLKLFFPFNWLSWDQLELKTQQCLIARWSVNPIDDFKYLQVFPSDQLISGALLITIILRLCVEIVQYGYAGVIPIWEIVASEFHLFSFVFLAILIFGYNNTKRFDLVQLDKTMLFIQFRPLSGFNSHASEKKVPLEEVKTDGTSERPSVTDDPKGHALTPFSFQNNPSTRRSRKDDDDPNEDDRKKLSPENSKAAKKKTKKKTKQNKEKEEKKNEKEDDDVEEEEEKEKPRYCNLT